MTKASNGKSANRSSTVQPHGTKTSTKDVRNGESSRQIMELIKTVSDKADKKRQESQDDVASKKWRCAENPAATAKDDQKALMDFTSSKLSTLRTTLEKKSVFNSLADLESCCKAQREYIVGLEVPEKGELAKFISQQEKQLRRELEILLG